MAIKSEGTCSRCHFGKNIKDGGGCWGFRCSECEQYTGDDYTIEPCKCLLVPNDAECPYYRAAHTKRVSIKEVHVHKTGVRDDGQVRKTDVSNESKCSFCDVKLYAKVTRTLMPLAAPLTRAEALRQELINLTGEDYVRVDAAFCPVCGRRKEVRDE